MNAFKLISRSLESSIRLFLVISKLHSAIFIAIKRPVANDSWWPRLCQNLKSPIPVEIINGLLIELHFKMGVTIDSW